MLLQCYPIVDIVILSFALVSVKLAVSFDIPPLMSIPTFLLKSPPHSFHCQKHLWIHIKSLNKDIYFPNFNVRIVSRSVSKHSWSKYPLFGQSDTCENPLICLQLAFPPQKSLTLTLHLPLVLLLVTCAVLFSMHVILSGHVLITSFRSEGGKKPRSSFQRSEEVGAAAEMRNRMIRQASKDSTDGSVGSISSDSSST